MADYLYQITPKRPGMPEEPTEAEAAAVEAHFGYLERHHDVGRVSFVGRTLTPPFVGLAVFDADDDEAAARFLNEDPGVAAGVFVGTVQPFRMVFPSP